MKNFFITLLTLTTAWLFSQLEMLAQAPTITAFSPASAVPGSVVTISGSGFSVNSGDNIVFFGETRATVVSSSVNSLTVNVPIGATFSPIMVINSSVGLAGYSRQNFLPIYSPPKTELTIGEFSPKINIPNGSNQTALTSADLDGDGRIDVATVDSYNNTLSVYRNNVSAGWLSCNAFESKVDFNTETSPVAVAAEDIDLDGKIDLVVVNSISNSVSIYQNTSSSGAITNASFSSPVSFTTGSNPRSVVCADIDGDGKPDLAVVNQGSGNISLLRNSHMGGIITSASFAAKVDFSAGMSSPLGIAVGHLDADNKRDVVVSSEYGDIGIFRNISTPGIINASSFASRADYYLGGGHGLRIADVDGDGKNDLLGAAGWSGYVYIRRNIHTAGAFSGSSFESAIYYMTESFPRSIDLGDLDGNGKPDLCVGSGYNDTFCILRNISTPGQIDESSFEPKLSLQSGVGSSAGPGVVRITDLDGDTRPDLVALNYNSPNFSIFKNMELTPQITSLSSVSGVPGSMLQINGNGFSNSVSGNAVFFGATQANIISANTSTISVNVPAGALSGPLQLVNKQNGQSCSSSSHFNPVFQPSKSSVSLSDFSAAMGLITGESNQEVTDVSIGDIDGDGLSDLISARQYGVISIFRRNSSSPNVLESSYDARVDFNFSSDSPVQTELADLDGDGKLDIVCTTYGNAVAVLRNNSTLGVISTASFEPPVYYYIDAAFGMELNAGLAIGDIDNDGKLDIVSVRGGMVSVLRNLSSPGCISATSFASKVDFLAGTNPSDVVLFDVDGDGKLDVATTNYDSNSISVLRNTSTRGIINAQSLSTAVDFAVNLSPNVLEVGDLDGDGKLDLICSNFNAHSISILENTSTIGIIDVSSFSSAMDIACNLYPTTLRVADLNGDGKQDIVTAGLNPIDYYQGQISVLNNNITSSSITTSGFSAPVHFNGLATSTNVYVNDIEIGDVDGNALPDMIVGRDGNSQGRNLVVLRQSDQAPVITSFTPANATVGSSVSISGSGFSSVTSQNKVFFGATQATITAATNSQLTVVVPSGATYAPLSFVNVGSNLSCVSSDFFNPKFSPSKPFLENYDFQSKVDFTAGTNPTAVIIVDLDGDGKSEMISVNKDSNSFSVYRNSATVGVVNSNSFEERIDFSTSDNPIGIVSADFDGDGKLDLAVLNSQYTISVFRNTSSAGSFGLASLSAPQNFIGLGINKCIAAGDVDRDGKVDIIVGYDDHFAVFKNLSSVGAILSNSFSSPIVFGSNINLNSLVVIDADGDGKLDVAGHDISLDGYLAIYRNVSVQGAIDASSFSSKVDFACYINSYNAKLEAADFDNDGKVDLALSHPVDVGTNTVTIFRNNATEGSIGSSSFFINAQPEVGSSPGHLCVADFTGDGLPDLAVANKWANTISVLSNTFDSNQPASITFSSQVVLSAASNWQGTIAAGDIDGDGKPDILFADEYANTISILRNADAVSLPTITSVLANADCEYSPTVTLTITGTNFSGITSVSLGGFEVISFTVNSTTEIEAVIDASYAGIIQVSAPIGNALYDNAYPFTWYLDADGDGYYLSLTSSCVSPGIGWSSNIVNPFFGDCDDSNPAIQIEIEICDGLDNNCNGEVDEYLLSTFFADLDGDNFGNPSNYLSSCTAPTGYVAIALDCNDSNPSIYWGAAEICNVSDDDCDGLVNEGLAFLNYYNDIDGDGYGSGPPTSACAQPSNMVSSNSDCNNSDASVNPGVAENCGDGIDNNCSGVIDEGCTTLVDADSDGFDATIDCNDNNNLIYPGSSETCNNLDDDCNGVIDNGLTFVNYYNDTDGDGYGSGTATNACAQPANTVANNTDCAPSDNTKWQTVDRYVDADGDGFGTGSLVSVCYGAAIPSGYSTNNTDCNDNNAALNSVTTETCNGFDDDCNGVIDNGLTFVNYYNDTDGDGYGAGTATNACQSPGVSYVTNNTDCNDNNATLNSITAETCNSFDDDCDGTVDNGLTFVNYYNDNDGDGYGAGTATNACQSPGISYVTNNTDCNDNNATLNSITAETCNSFDDDCDGTVDNGLTFVNYYNDNDGDGYGAGTATNACQTPGASYVTNNTDCNDNNATLNSITAETCNNLDDDCDGTVDNGLNFVNYYNDNDGDGDGAGTATNACQTPGASYVTNNTDCNDNNAAIQPGATELCSNGIDDNCNGQVNENCSSGGIAGEDPGNAVSVINVPAFGFGVQNNFGINLAQGSNSIESPGSGNDVWYSFVATGNAARIALTGSAAVADDNAIELYSSVAAPGTVWVPLSTEDDVHPGSLGTLSPAPDGGSEILYYGNLVPNQTYYLCLRNVNDIAGTCNLSVSFLRGSQADILPFTGGTGIYNNTCANFKSAFRSQSSGYVVRRWQDEASANAAVTPSGLGQGTPSWSYAIPPQTSGVGYTMCQLGKILPANLSSGQQTYYVTVDVIYNLKDAAGNNNTLTAFGTVASPVILNAEAPLTVRSTDLCSVGFKRTTAFIATNRSVCGTARYDWKFKMAYPTQGLPTYIAGGAGATRLVGMGSIPGIANGQRYDVWVRAAHLDGVSYSVGTAVGSPLQVNTWFPTTGGCPSNTSATCPGNASCVKTIGNAGMVLAEQENEEEVNAWSPQHIQLFPNPNAGYEVMLSVTGMEGVIQIEVMDAMGRLLQSTTSYSEGHITLTLSFEKTLTNGLYEVRVSNGKEQRVVRMVVGR